MKLIEKFSKLGKSDKTIFFLLIIAINNIIMAITKLTFSFLIPSLWFFINAIFNIILSLLRLFSIRDYQKMRLEKNNQLKRDICFKNYSINGILLILLGITYFIVSVYIYYNGTNTNMHEYLTYLVALMSFYSIGTSIYGIYKYKKNQNPILKGVKITNFANSLTLIVLTQVVLLDTFNKGFDERIANSSVGIIASIIIIGLGLYIIFDKNNYNYSKR